MQSCSTLCDPMDYSLQGSSVYGISQSRILEWVAFPSSRGSSWRRHWTQVSCIADRFFLPSKPPGKPGNAGPCFPLQTRAYRMGVSFVWTTSLPRGLPSLRWWHSPSEDLMLPLKVWTLCQGQPSFTCRILKSSVQTCPCPGPNIKPSDFSTPVLGLTFLHHGAEQVHGINCEQPWHHSSPNLQTEMNKLLVRTKTVRGYLCV